MAFELGLVVEIWHFWVKKGVGPGTEEFTLHPLVGRVASKGRIVRAIFAWLVGRYQSPHARFGWPEHPAPPRPAPPAAARRRIIL